MKWRKKVFTNKIFVAIMWVLVLAMLSLSGID